MVYKIIKLEIIKKYKNKYYNISYKILDSKQEKSKKIYIRKKNSLKSMGTKIYIEIIEAIQYFLLIFFITKEHLFIYIRIFYYSQSACSLEVASNLGNQIQFDLKSTLFRFDKKTTILHESLDQKPILSMLHLHINATLARSMYPTHSESM